MCLDLLTVHFRFIGGTASEESSLHTKNMEHTALHTEQPFPHHCIAISTLHTSHVHGVIAQCTMIGHITLRHYIALHCTHTAQSHCTAVHNYRTLTEALHTNCAMHSERPCTLQVIRSSATPSCLHQTQKLPPLNCNKLLWWSNTFKKIVCFSQKWQYLL